MSEERKDIQPNINTKIQNFDQQKVYAAEFERFIDFFAKMIEKYGKDIDFPE